MATARKRAVKPAPAPAAASAATKTAAKKAVASKAPAKKTAAKPAVAAKPVVSKAAAASKPASAPEVAKPVKVKLVRDGFTIPAGEYAVLAELKQRALAAAHPVKKSELLRAGIKLLAALSDKALMAALADVPAIKTGRPGKK